MNKLEITSLPDREKIVARMKESSAVGEHNLIIGGVEKKLSIYMVPIEALVYNLKNFRTIGEQESYLQENKKIPIDFFKNGQENISSQNIQHQFLLDKAKEGGESSLYQEFEEGNAYDKNDPIVVTNKLLIRDGNRRLSVLRDLYNNSKTKYEHLQKVPCAIIFDPTTEREEELYELDKQMKEDLKAPYEWYNQALFHRHLVREHKLNDEQICKKTKIKQIDLEKARFALTLAERYLKNNDIEGNYKTLKGKEQFWTDYAGMQRHANKNIKNPNSQYIWKAQQFISETIVGSAASLKAEGAGRIYAPHKKLCEEQNVVKAINILADHHNIKITTKATNKLLGGSKMSQSKEELAALQVKELEKIYDKKVISGERILGIIEELKADKDIRYIEKELVNMSSKFSQHIDPRVIPPERYDKINKAANLLKNKIDDYVDKLLKFKKKLN